MAGDIQVILGTSPAVFPQAHTDIRDKLAIQGIDPAPYAASSELQQLTLNEAPMWEKLVNSSDAKVDGFECDLSKLQELFLGSLKLFF